MSAASYIYSWAHLGGVESVVVTEVLQKSKDGGRTGLPLVNTDARAAVSNEGALGHTHMPVCTLRLLLLAQRRARQGLFWLSLFVYSCMKVLAPFCFRHAVVSAQPPLATVQQ